MISFYKTSKYSGNHENNSNFKVKSSDFTLQLNEKIKLQKVLGFGGAFTEAAALTFSKLSKANQEKILMAYFDQETGLRYNLGRVAIHSCDFALENYTYVDDYDETLTSFSIKREYQWVIPMIKDAIRVRKSQIQLLASPWSPPAWMKSNNDMNHGGKLLPKYYQTWANYYLKFIEAYTKAGLNIFAISVQNEPAAKQIWDSCEYTAEEERDFVSNFLGPTIQSSQYKDVKIIIWDHNRDILFERADTVLKDPKANQYVWGTGVHWYVSEAFENLTKIHHKYPDKHLLFTEGCIEGGVALNEFKSGERYVRNMIGDFSNHCEGYIDWNLLLDDQGGPNHVGNYCDAPIICDTKNDIVHFNSSYYAIGHFSKYIDIGALRIQSESNHPFLRQVAFKNPDDSIVVIIQNETEEETTINIDYKNNKEPISIDKRSINTIILRGE